MILFFVTIIGSLALSTVSDAIDCRACTSDVPEGNQCATPSDWRVESSCVACGLLNFQFRDNNNNEDRRGGNGQWVQQSYYTCITPTMLAFVSPVVIDKLGLRSAVQLQQQQQNGGGRFTNQIQQPNNRQFSSGRSQTNGLHPQIFDRNGGGASSFNTQSNQNSFGTYNIQPTYSPNDQNTNFTNGNNNDDLVCADNAELIKQFQVDAVNGLEHEQYEQEQQPQRAYRTDEYRVGLFRTFTFPDLLRNTQMCVCFGDRCTDQFQPGQALPVSQYNGGEKQFQQQQNGPNAGENAYLLGAPQYRQQNGFGATNNGQQDSQLNFASDRLARQLSSLRALPNTLPIRFSDEEVREAPLTTTSNSSRTITNAKTPSD